jgi:hypothetical protein
MNLVRDPFTKPCAGDIYEIWGLQVHIVYAAYGEITYYCSSPTGTDVGPSRHLPVEVFLAGLHSLDGQRQAKLIYAAR